MRKEKAFHLKNALSLVSIDFHTPLRYLVAGMMWENVCHASDFKIVVLHLIVLETPARMMLHTSLASYIFHKASSNAARCSLHRGLQVSTSSLLLAIW